MSDDTAPIIALLGDSTLDNVVWVESPADSIRDQLLALLPPSSQVLNLAADGFTTSHMLEGAYPSISFAAREEAGDPFPPMAEDGTFKPLEALADEVGPKFERVSDVNRRTSQEFTLTPGTPVSHSVLSVGGNDIRVILGQMHKLESVMASFSEAYPKIMDAITTSTPNLIVQLQYKPSQNMDQVYRVYAAMDAIPGEGSADQKMSGLMTMMYNPIIAKAKEAGLPIIDLSNTFDPTNDELYRSQIEPSAIGGGVIAKLIAHVALHHDFTGPSHIYSASDGGLGDIISTPTPDSWTCYPHGTSPPPSSSPSSCTLS